MEEEMRCLTSEAEDYKELQKIILAVDEVMENTALLDNIKSEDELEQVMPVLLASLGKYAQADRSYIFELKPGSTEMLHMTHVWCAEGISPTFREMQDLSLSIMPNWFSILNRDRVVVTYDWEADQDRWPEEYQLFSGQGIHSIIIIPLISGGMITGYIGMDNPQHRRIELSVSLLKGISGHIGGLKENLYMVKQLEENQTSLQESLKELNKERKKLEDALAEATLNSEIIGSISKIYWLIYRIDLVEGIYEEISAAQETHKLTGKRGYISDILEEMCNKIVSDEHRPMMREFWDVSTLPQRLKETDSIAIEYQTRSGPWNRARIIAKKRDIDGNVLNVLYVVRRIDREKQKEIEYKQQLMAAAEDARRANMAKTDFLRRMSHDIRTPINGIQGMISIAEHFPDDIAKQKECRDKVKEASGFLLDLVNNILDMNKLESGAIVLEHVPFNLRDVLQETNDIAEMNAELRGLQVSIDHTRIRQEHLIGSPLHLKQILQNIEGNAVKYNREGGSISLTASEIDCADGMATYQFICTDTGRGMSRAFLEHAFEPFAQEDTSARTAYMGTGLGLPIAKQLAEMMGGKIEVESEQNVGTTFTITIPFEIDIHHTADSMDEQEIQEADVSGVRVLLAEDNELNMEIARFILENAGMEVTTVFNGKEAVDTFSASEENQFGLILMDVMMPVMDGLTAARTIRAMKRMDARKVPIFAMTANAFADDIEESRKAGMNEHLSKPLDEDRMMRVIRQYMAR